MSEKKTPTSSNGNILGLGTDIIEIERIQEAIKRHGQRFLERLFTNKEQAYCLRYRDSAARFAGRFAAKEAILKAIGTGLREEITWKEIEILNNAEGKPEVWLGAVLRKKISTGQILLSISHCQTYATATAILIA